MENSEILKQGKWSQDVLNQEGLRFDILNQDVLNQDVKTLYLKA